MAYRDLSIRERHAIIRAGVANGVRNLTDIEAKYNEFVSPSRHPDYDIEAYVRENPSAVFTHPKDVHFTDKYKLPNHPTFSDESVYTTQQTPGGHWNSQEKTFEPSTYMLDTYGSTPTIERLHRDDPDYTAVYQGGVLLPDVEVHSYANGGIHIKPSKRGTFTAAATKHGKSVQAFASQVLAHKENYSSAMVKKANFARNFGGHKHVDGGYNLTSSPDAELFLDDYAYRAALENPSITPDRVTSAISNLNFETQNREGIGGTYDYSSKTVYLPNINKWSQQAGHEIGGHHLRNELFGNMSAVSSDRAHMLEEALPNFYVPLEEVQKSRPLQERLATNTELRAAIIQNTGLSGKALDEYVNTMSDVDLLSLVYRKGNGYITGSKVPFMRKEVVLSNGQKANIDDYIDLQTVPEGHTAEDWLGISEEERQQLIKEYQTLFDSNLTEEDKKQAKALRWTLLNVAQNNSSFQKSDNTYLAALGGNLSRNAAHLHEDGGDSNNLVRRTVTSSAPLLRNFWQQQNDSIEETLENLPLFTIARKVQEDRMSEKDYQDRVFNSSGHKSIPYRINKVKDFENFNKLFQHEANYIQRKNDYEQKYAIPNLPSKQVRLAPGMSISGNVIDSIAKYAELYGIDVRDALGLAMRETNLSFLPPYTWAPSGSSLTNLYNNSGHYMQKMRAITPSELFNNHSYWNSPYTKEFNYIVKQAGGNPVTYGIPEPLLESIDKEQVTSFIAGQDSPPETWSPDFNRLFRGGVGSESRPIELRTVFNDKNDRHLKMRLPTLDKKAEQQIEENPYFSAFKMYQTGNYNPGDSTHTKAVQEAGDWLMSLPAIQEILNARNWEHSTGGPLYPFSFSKRPLPPVRY